MLNFVPMVHKVTVTSASKELDAWGLPVASSYEIEYRARVTYNTSRKTIQVTSGEEVVYTAEILLEGVPAITFSDTIMFTDSIGNSVEKKPLSIQYKNDFSGSPILVKVVV